MVSKMRLLSAGMGGGFTKRLLGAAVLRAPLFKGGLIPVLSLSF
jgi:hypothetical protein